MSRSYYSLIKIFDDAGNTLSAPHAGGDNPVFFIQTFHIVDQLYGQLAAGAAERMAQCNRAAIDIDDIRIELQLPDDSQGLRRKGFIQLDQVNLAEVHSCLTQDPGNGFDRADPHDPGMDPRSGTGYEPGNRLQPQLFYHLLTH